MKEIRKITDQVFLLLIEILVFTYQTISEVILPTRRRKGNILYSLLSFFVGLIERTLSFEKSILPRPVVFKHKYVKQGLMIAAGLLFLLSSIEWTVGPPAGDPVKETLIVTIKESVTDAPVILAQRRANTAVQITAGNISPSYKISYLLSDETITFNRWLRYRSFRI
jgi:hypothetical protein